MIIALPDAIAVTVSVLMWVLTSVVMGRWAVTWPDDRLDHTGPLTTLRTWERDGGSWQRWLRVLRWKDRLPEAGAAFAGGRAKRRIGTSRSEDLRAFRRETVRAERVHWLIMASGPLHLLWCRPTVGAGMVGFGVAFDLPFILVQRVNRGRIDRILRRRAAGRAAGERTAPLGEPVRGGRRPTVDPHADEGAGQDAVADATDRRGRAGGAGPGRHRIAGRPS